MSERYEQKEQYTEKTSGAQGPAGQTGSGPTSEFSEAHSASRSGHTAWGSYTGGTSAGVLGNSPMESPDTDGQSESHGSPTMVNHVGSMPTCAAYAWPDATGGGLVGSSDGSHTTSGSQGSPMTGPGGDQR